MAQTPARRTLADGNGIWIRVFGMLTGLFLTLVLVKFGNPVIFDDKFNAPQNIWELMLQPWPFAWGYSCVAVLTIAAFKAGKWQVLDRKAKFWLLLPLIWWAWQFVSATGTVSPKLTAATLKHFTACIACFYIGCFSLGEIRDFRPILLGVLIGLAIVIFSGWDQHFGGLEQTRRFFYELPNWREYPPEFIRKISSNRIYATLFYPNTLAAALLLFLPPGLAALWSLTVRWSIAARIVLVGLFGCGALVCLFWSGSKSGWLLALLLGMIGLLQLSFSPTLKKTLLIALVLIGLGGFVVKYAGFFQKGATSVVARFDYWRAATAITKEHPFLGTGPGTFAIPYGKLKKPEAEMARLCHNDYLEQASDSGIVGFLSYTIFIIGTLIFCRPQGPLGSISFSVWLGLVGVSLHSLMEFNLYIPAIAWPSFLFFGWLWALRFKETFDKKQANP